MKRVGLWSMTLGAVGFACGFFGPISLNPSANQGPLLGLFITGPGGCVLGAVLGLVADMTGLPASLSRRVLIALAIVGGGTILFFCLPEPEYLATLVDFEVRECAPPLTRKAQALATWEKRLAVNSWAQPPADWQHTLDQTAAGNSVLRVAVARHREIFQEQKPWNRGDFVARDWSSARSRRMMRPDEFYVRVGCTAYAVGSHHIRLARAEPGSNTYPPTTPASFLDMLVLEDVPPEFQQFAAR